jgi:hypothetical protein
MPSTTIDLGTGGSGDINYSRDRLVEDWITLSVGHEGGAVIDLWRQHDPDHKNAFLRYFRNNPWLLHLHLGEDGPEEIARFLGEEILFQLSH